MLRHLKTKPKAFRALVYERWRNLPHLGRISARIGRRCASTRSVLTRNRNLGATNPPLLPLGTVCLCHQHQADAEFSHHRPRGTRSQALCLGVEQENSVSVGSHDRPNWNTSPNPAMWQAKTVSAALEANGVATELVPLTSTGDRSLGGELSSSVGQFIHSIDNRLLSGEIDIAVHSSKDVPVDVDERITNLAYLERGCTTDLVLMRKTSEVPVLEEVLSPLRPPRSPPFWNGLVVAPPGTVSGRRQSFLLSKRPDIIPLAVATLRRALPAYAGGWTPLSSQKQVLRLNSIGVLDGFKADISAFASTPTTGPQHRAGRDCRPLFEPTVAKIERTA